jgi:hypothetical protein
LPRVFLQHGSVDTSWLKTFSDTQWFLDPSSHPLAKPQTLHNSSAGSQHLAHKQHRHCQLLKASGHFLSPVPTLPLPCLMVLRFSSDVAAPHLNLGGMGTPSLSQHRGTCGHTSNT